MNRIINMATAASVVSATRAIVLGCATPAAATQALTAGRAREITHFAFLETRRRRLTGQSVAFSLSREGGRLRVEGADAGDLLSFLGASGIIHHGRAAGIALLDEWLTETGRLPLDNDQLDVATAADQLVAAYALEDWDTTIAGLARRAGVPARQIDASDSAAGEAEVVASIMHGLIGGALAQLARRDEASFASPEDRRPLDWLAALPEDARVLLAGPALPDPGVEPAADDGPWRHTPWSNGEQTEAALMFRRGMTLAMISSRLRRRPAAIRARLMLDGVIAPGTAAMPDTIAL